MIDSIRPRKGYNNFDMKILHCLSTNSIEEVKFLQNILSTHRCDEIGMLANILIRNSIVERDMNNSYTFKLIRDVADLENRIDMMESRLEKVSPDEEDLPELEPKTLICKGCGDVITDELVGIISKGWYCKACYDEELNS